MAATIYGAQKDVYLTGTQQLYALGQKLETPDGSIFRFAELNSTLGVANNLYQASAPVANWEGTDLSTAMAIGDTTITFKDGGTAFVVDEAAGGSIHVEETGDLGYVYPIKSNLVTASNETVMTLEDGITVIKAVTANALTFIKNPWKEILIHASPATSYAVGVPRVIIAADGFGWMQTRGVASCLANGTQGIQQDLCPSNAVSGALANKRTVGTDTLLTTSLAVTHNSGHTPIGSDITIHYLEDPTTDPETRWLGTFTTTQFTVNIKTDTGANDMDFGWTLEVVGPVVAVNLAVGATAEFNAVFLKVE